MQTETKNENKKSLVSDIAFYSLIGLMGLSALAAVGAIIYWVLIG
jgi:hypothetical protein